MSEEKEAIPAKLRQAYSNIPELRAAMQLIPYLGSTIDTLIAGRFSQTQIQRLEDFARVLALRMKRVERLTANLNDEAFADLALATFERVARARSETKRARFAEILAREVEVGAPWEEAEAAVRLLSELEDVHMTVLRAALNAPPMGKPFEGLRLVSPVPNRESLRSELDGRSAEPQYLPQLLPTFTPLAIRMACVDLISRGLLHDEGVGRWGTVNLELLMATDLAEWFAVWISIR